MEFVDFCQLGVVGGVKDLFWGEVGSVDFRQARGVVDEAWFSGVVESDEFCQVGGVVDLACFSEGVKFVDFCRAGVVDVACFL